MQQEQQQQTQSSPPGIEANIFPHAITVPATYLSPTSITCPPPYTTLPGCARVRVTLNGQEWSVAQLPFTYLPPLELLRVEPAWVPLGECARYTDIHKLPD